MTDIRPLAMCKFSDDHLPKEYRGGYPFDKEHMYIYFGEIPNMMGHCVVMDHSTGEVTSGYHTDLFSELTDEET